MFQWECVTGEKNRGLNNNKVPFISDGWYKIILRTTNYNRSEMVKSSVFYDLHFLPFSSYLGGGSEKCGTDWESNTYLTEATKFPWVVILWLVRCNELGTRHGCYALNASRTNIGTWMRLVKKRDMK